MNKQTLSHGAAVLLSLACAGANAQQASADDTQAAYSHSLPLTVSGSNAVVQLRLPPAVYLHARSADLHDLRLFDANGKPVPFALMQPAPRSEASRRNYPFKVFSVAAPAGQRGVRSDVQVRQSADGSTTSVTTSNLPLQAEGTDDATRALMLDLGPQVAASRAPLDTLVFTLPAGMDNYHAQVMLEVSDDLANFETVGYASLSWLANSARDTLSNNRMRFEARPFRYARLTWREGKPVQFASVVAESPLSTSLAPQQDSVTLAPRAGKFAHDLVYDAAIAIPATRLNLRFAENNVALPAQIGHYARLPAPRGQTSTKWEFRPRLQTTFFKVNQNGKQRGSADVALEEAHVQAWVIRPQAPLAGKPELVLSWTPASLVFMASGAGPYSLAFGRLDAQRGERNIAQVAPGFSAAELQTLEQAVPGVLKLGIPAAPAASEAEKAGASARTRMMALWAVLLAGVGVLAFMVWRLLGQMKQPQ